MKVQVLGVHWGAYLEQGHLLAITHPTAASEYSAPLMRTREELENWLGTHSGDFSEIMDFAALPDIPFESEDNEMLFWDLMYGEPS
mgnify:FL=1